MAAKRSSKTLDAWFGDEMLIEGGAMRFEGSLRVDGSIRDGHIVGGSLIVGEPAKVDGRLTLDKVEVYGQLEGRVEISGEARIEPGGSFRGEMILDEPSLVIEEGGAFHGRVRMAK